MTDGNTHAINKHLDEREDWDALQEVTAKLEQAESWIEEVEEQRNFTQGLVLKLDAKLAKAQAQIAEVEEQRNFTQGLVLRLDAKLAKATDTLARIVRGDDDAHNWAIWTLAELKGEQ